jgi:ankyrin repeat protein
LLYRFRWVFCQLETLRHCFPPNLREFLNELPDTLDETYGQILRGINKAQKEDARRLLQCLTVAARPLRVEELAELLAFDFQATSERGIPTLREDWRWNDQEQAVLSTCSSLITIVRNEDSRLVQFSHFSVKEYLTSPRLARSSGDISRFYVDLNAAHTILAQACLGTLLRLDDHACNSSSERFPLVEYAAQHWVEHAQFVNVSSRVWDGMADLFDSSKPHFVSWLRVHDIDKRWDMFSDGHKDDFGSPLYYAAFCGLHDLAERLIVKHPEQVNAAGGFNLAPLPAALSMKHFHVANLLHKHGAVVDVRDDSYWTSLHVASQSGGVDITRWLLDRGAAANARNELSRTPLHMAARKMDLKIVQVLLEHNPEINARDYEGITPLYDALAYGESFPEGKVVEMIRLLLERGADPNMRDDSHSTPLHQASSSGWLEIARLLLSHGAKVDEKDGDGWTPFEVATSKGFHELTKLLLEHGAVPPL